MSESNNHINYSAADIEKYYRGALSPAERHAMEKAALDDPFLADAMEGYEGRYAALRTPDSEAPVSHDLEELEKRLAIRTGEKKKAAVVKFSWWKVAAVIIVFIGAGWLYTTINSNAKKDIADMQVKKEPVPAPPAVAPASTLPLRADTIKASDAVVAKERKSSSANRNASSAYKQAGKAGDGATAAASAPVVAQNAEAEKDLSLETLSVRKTPAQMVPAPDTVQGSLARQSDKADRSFLAAGKKESVIASDLAQQAPGVAVYNEREGGTTPVNTFNGTVVDQLNRPVANATIQIPNLNIATTTDNKGYFSFAAPDTTLSVSIASLGFETQQLSLHNNETLNQITLKPDSKALNEVVVTGYGTKRKKETSRKTKNLTITILGAEPVISWDEYNDYLDKNKRIPAGANNLHGETVVGFTIDKQNLLKDFRIEKSVHEQLDAEAIRLIKEGPAWRLLKGRKAKVSVIVKF